MDIERIRHLLAGGAAVVVAEEGKPPLVVRELPDPDAPATREPATEEVPIASRWPKGRSINEEPRQDQVLERLNKEILALRDQITQNGDPVQGQEPAVDAER